MPGKKTYGKRKKSILSLFPVQNDDPSLLESANLRMEKRASSTVSMTAFYGKPRNDLSRNSRLVPDESSEEAASKLLDESSVDQLVSKRGTYDSLSQSEKYLSQSHQRLSFQEKILPQLPQLLFNDDSIWRMRSSSIATAARTSNKAIFNGDEEDSDSCPPPVPRQPARVRQSSAPPLPRKSSKRASRRPNHRRTRDSQNTTQGSNKSSESQELTKVTQQSLGGLFNLSEATNSSNLTGSPDISQQIEAMLIATSTLKPTDDSMMSGIPTASKKVRVKGAGMLSKIKQAINEALLEKGMKIIRHPTKADQLLNPIRSQLPEYEDDISTVSAMELRLNEGTNFNNPKIQSLTGHGTIRRKPVAEDGKSLKSPKSGDDPFSDGSHSVMGRESGIVKTRYQKEMSVDESAEYVSPILGMSRRLRANTMTGSSVRRTELSFETDFDDLFSSSPVAQSTPRIRLEPSFEDSGKKNLKHVPASSRSLFDPENMRNKPAPAIAATSTITPIQNTPTKKVVAKRNNSQVKDRGLSVKTHLSKRRKKHPSPSKAELEGLEDALKHYSPLIAARDTHGQDDLADNFGELRTEGMLQDRDNNASLKAAPKRWPKEKRPALAESREQSVAASSLAEPARRPPAKVHKASMIPTPAGGARVKERIKSRTVQLRGEDESAMDTDELQWDLTAYQIGRKGF